jgi:hypothetical protein
MDTSSTKDFLTLISFVQVMHRVMHRKCVHYLFLQLKRRFGSLSGTLRIKLESIPKYIVATAVLHNMAKHFREEDFSEPPDMEPAPESSDNDVLLQPHDVAGSSSARTADQSNALRRGKRRQAHIAEFILSNGLVPKRDRA